MKRTPLSDTRCNNESMYAGNLGGVVTSHQIFNLSYASGVARKKLPIGGDRNDTLLNIDSGIVDKMPNLSGLGPHNAREVVHLNRLRKAFRLRNSLPDIA